MSEDRDAQAPPVTQSNEANNAAARMTQIPVLSLFKMPTQGRRGRAILGVREDISPKGSAESSNRAG